VRASQLRQLLEKKVGGEQLEFRIPQIFLPPRYRNLSEGRDLLLMLDDDLTIHIRWHNETFHEHHPLTPGETKRLMGEVMMYIKRYREHFRVFGTFVCEHAELPWDEERYHDGFCQEEEAPQRAKEARPEEEEELTAEGQEEEQTIASQGERDSILRSLDNLIELSASNVGGETPCPDLDY
jgi:hypothetical protein